jgi:uncharacterized protein (DUF2225 family)
VVERNSFKNLKKIAVSVRVLSALIVVGIEKPLRRKAMVRVREAWAFCILEYNWWATLYARLV